MGTGLKYKLLSRVIRNIRKNILYSSPGVSNRSNIMISSRRASHPCIDFCSMEIPQGGWAGFHRLRPSFPDGGSWGRPRGEPGRREHKGSSRAPRTHQDSKVSPRRGVCGGLAGRTCGSGRKKLGSKGGFDASTLLAELDRIREASVAQGLVWRFKTRYRLCLEAISEIRIHGRCRGTSAFHRVG